MVTLLRPSRCDAQHPGSFEPGVGFGRGLPGSHLHQLHHVGVVQLLEDGDLLVDLLDGPAGLHAALGGGFGPAGWWAACGKGKDGVLGQE